MFEIDDPDRRKALLSQLGGVEQTCVLTVDGEDIVADAETDLDRTTADGNASSVQFLHFRMNEVQAAAFKRAGTRILLGIQHSGYGHIAVVPEHIRTALAADLD